MSDHPDDERINDSHAAMTRATRRRQRSTTVEMSLIAGAAVMIAFSAAFSAWNSFEIRRLSKVEAEVRRLTLLGAECLVEQMAEHRHLNALAHRENARTHNYSYPIDPKEEPPPVPGELERACATFISSTTSTSSP